jgi:hypothetical protein
LSCTTSTKTKGTTRGGDDEGQTRDGRGETRDGRGTDEGRMRKDEGRTRTRRGRDGELKQVQTIYQEKKLKKN